MSTEERLENMEEKVASVDEKVGRMDESLREIKTALLGNEFSQARGFIHKQNDLDARVATLERFLERWKWFLLGLSVAAGIGGASILNAIASLISKFAK